MEERECIECGEKFKINEKDFEFYKKKNFKLPKRCPECRKFNRKERKFIEEQMFLNLFDEIAIDNLVKNLKIQNYEKYNNIGDILERFKLKK